MEKKKRLDREEDESRVKMYKTHHGWVSCLTRFFHLLSFGSKQEVNAKGIVDPDAISDHKLNTTDAYMKGLSAIAAMVGVGLAGAANPTAVHAAEQTVNTGSQVLGSGSETNSTSNSEATNSNSTTTSTSGSTSTTTSTSGSTSQSMSGSQSGSGSVSQSTSGSQSNRGSNSTSITSGVRASSTSLTGTQASVSVADSAPTNASLTVKDQTDLSANQLAGLINVNLIQQVNSTSNVSVSTASDFVAALLNNDISTIDLNNDIDLSSYNYNKFWVEHDVVVNANGHKLWFNGGSANNLWVYAANQNTPLHVTFNDAVIYSNADHGAFRMSNTGPNYLTSRNVNLN